LGSAFFNDIRAARDAQASSTAQLVFRELTPEHLRGVGPCQLECDDLLQHLSLCDKTELEKFFTRSNTT
jgi:hypothetical protein